MNCKEVGQARRIVTRILSQSEPARQRAQFTLSPAAADRLSIGGRASLPDVEGIWQVMSLQRGDAVEVEAMRLSEVGSEAILTGPDVAPSSDPAWTSEPVAAVFDLPGTDGLQVGALMDPFRPATFTFEGESVETNAPVRIGALLTDLPSGPVEVWDEATEIDIWMPGAQLVARPRADVTIGQNHFAVETSLGWEIIGAADIVLTGPETYRMRTMLRGLSNSDDGQVDLLPAGARIVALDSGLATLPIEDDHIGQTIDIPVQAGGRTGVSASLTYRAVHKVPLSPVHLSVEDVGGSARLSWIPRNLDGSDEVRADAVFRISWAEEALEVSGTSADLPLAVGSDIIVSVVEVSPLTGAGGVAEITL